MATALAGLSPAFDVSALAVAVLALSAVALLEVPVPAAVAVAVELVKAFAPAWLALAAWAVAELELAAEATAEEDEAALPFADDPSMAVADALDLPVAMVVAWLWLSAIDWAELEPVACAELDPVPSLLESAVLASALADAVPPPADCDIASAGTEAVGVAVLVQLAGRVWVTVPFVVAQIAGTVPAAATLFDISIARTANNKVCVPRGIASLPWRRCRSGGR